MVATRPCLVRYATVQIILLHRGEGKEQSNGGERRPLMFVFSAAVFQGFSFTQYLMRSADTLFLTLLSFVYSSASSYEWTMCERKGGRGWRKTGEETKGARERRGKGMMGGG